MTDRKTQEIAEKAGAKGHAPARNQEPVDDRQER